MQPLFALIETENTLYFAETGKEKRAQRGSNDAVPAFTEQACQRREGAWKTGR
jgi:hypothetical protein